MPVSRLSAWMRRRRSSSGSYPPRAGNGAPRATRSGSTTTASSPPGGTRSRPSPTGSMTSPRTAAGSTSASTTTPPRSPWRRSAAGGPRAGQDDPLAPVRQDLYLRALSTLPHVSTHLGHFLVTKTRMALATPPPAGPRTVEVLKTEEKGSDVNLATYLLADAFRGDCQTAVVLSLIH